MRTPKIIYCLLFFTITYINPIKAQYVKGIILDSNNNPIELATLAIYEKNGTNNLIKSALTKRDGTFYISYQTMKDSLCLHIAHIGYINQKIYFTTNITDIGIIILDDAPYALDEIEIIASQKAFSLKDGELKIHINKLSNNNADKLLDILKRLPGFIITDNSISINGNIPKIKIDGIKQYIPIETLMNYLSSMPADEIESISINTTPMAENKIGDEDILISINTKKNKIDGYNISNSSYGQLFRHNSHKYGNYSDIMMRYNNLSSSLSFGISDRSLYSSNEESCNKEHTVSKGRFSKLAYFGVLNMSWTPKIINGSINLFTSYYKDNGQTRKKEQYFLEKNDTQIIQRNNDEIADLLSFNIEYTNNDTLKKQFKVSYGLLTGENNFTETYKKNNIENKFYTNRFFTGNQHIIDAQYKYKTKRFELKLGTQTYLSKLIETYSKDYIIKGQKSTIKENINSIYTSLNSKLSEHLSMYAGIRWEYTNYKYPIDNMIEKEQYSNFLPTLSFNYNVTENYSTSLKLSLENIRPNYYSILPSKISITENEYQKGNLKITPATKYRLKTENLLFKHIYIDAYIQWTKNHWSTYYGLDQNNIRYTTIENIGNLFTVYSSVFIPFTLLNNKVKGSINLNNRYTKYTSIKEWIRLSNNNGFWFTSGNLYIGYEASPKLNFYLNPYFKTKQENIFQERKGYITINSGIQYSLLKNNSLTLSITTGDIFNQEKYISKTNYNNKTVNYKSESMSQYCMLTLTYKINKNIKNIKIRRNENDIDRFAN